MTSMKLLQNGGALVLLYSWNFDFLQSTETQYRADSCKMGWEECSRVQFWNCSQCSCSCSGQGTRTRTMRKAQRQAINNQKTKNKKPITHYFIILFCYCNFSFFQFWVECFHPWTLTYLYGSSACSDLSWSPHHKLKGFWRNNSVPIQLSLHRYGTLLS